MMSRLFSVLLLALLALPAAAKIVEEIDHIVAVVNDDVITATELERQLRMIKTRLQRQQTRLPPDPVLRKQVLDQMIMEQLQLQEAARIGIRIDDETVNRVIAGIARDNNLTLEQFRQVLTRDGFDFASYREQIRNSLTINQLRKQRVESRINVSEREVANYLTNQANRKGHDDDYRLAHILVALPEAASPEQIAAARRKAEAIHQRLEAGADFTQTAIAESNAPDALQGGDLGWRKAGQLPSLFADVVRKLQPGQISDVIRSPSGFHIVKLIDRRSREDRHVVQQTLARHILIKPDEMTSSEAAHAELLRIRERLEAGADFGEIARAVSDDTASAAEGGSLGWVSPGTMVPRFEEEMNRLQPGQISQPFQTRFGWHIVQVMARRQHDDTEAWERQQARRLIAKRKIDIAMRNWLRELRSTAYVEYRLNQ